MNACIFVGPTLAPADASAMLDAVYLPPVQQGDVYRAAVRHRPRALGIVDGYFQHVPSVWHKEILWAMAEGIHVFGSASMGALRAAELSAFGMRGVGRTVFEGARVDEFGVRILGVLENAVGPRQSLILARLEGGPLASTGVIAGMSGSPVFVDGKLVGAVAYAFPFGKEPIAGLTPIGAGRGPPACVPGPRPGPA